MDGGTYGDIIYMPFLIALVLIGMAFALVGFLRVGASYAVQYSAQVGAVAPEEGGNVLAILWRGWSNADGQSGSFAVDEEARTVTANVNTATSYDFSAFGMLPWTFSIGAGGELHVRSERFYPGEPVCDEGGCGE
jgi:hypothetical protein